jgi:catechol 2,3-dioxygenase-like lactoylglutathione lyase family enzyme
MINLDVPDLDAAIRFYEDGLGLRLRRTLFSRTVAEMTGAAATIYLLEKREGSRAAPGLQAARSYSRHWTPLHLDFVVNDVWRAVERAQDAGAALELGPESFVWGHLAALSDPFGHGFCLVQWSGRGYDEAA